MSLHILLPGDAIEASSLQVSPLASARLRLWPAAQAAAQMGMPVTIGERCPAKTDILLIGKIGANDILKRTSCWLQQIATMRQAGTRVLLDYTDHHLASGSVMTPFYQDACLHANTVCVPTVDLKMALDSHPGVTGGVSVVSDPLEYDLVPPKASLPSGRIRSMWFGHPSNATFLAQFIQRYSEQLAGQALHIVSAPQTVEVLKQFRFSSPPDLSLSFEHWNVQAVSKAAVTADYCIIPSDPASPKRYASNNRLVSALALGLPTIATALPSYREVGDFFAETETPSALELMANPLEFSQQVVSFQNNEIGRFTRATVLSSWVEILGTH